MVQYEVAKRIIAYPSSKAYGRLSINVQRKADVFLQQIVPDVGGGELAGNRAGSWAERAGALPWEGRSPRRYEWQRRQLREEAARQRLPLP